MKEKITREDVITLLDKSQNSDLAVKYDAWSKLDSDDETKLTFIGKVAIDQDKSQAYSTKENYWSPKYPISLEHYPNCGSDIHTDGRSYFLVYLEFGGHAPEKRCRIIKKELLI